MAEDKALDSVKTLVVDDSKVMRRMIVNILTEAGVSAVVEAGNGLEAVDAVDTQNGEDGIGLVLMDWNMPELNGIDAVKKIRSAGHTMPIVMVTSEADRARVVTALKAGANNYIIKPFDPPALIEKIIKVLSLNLS